MDKTALIDLPAAAAGMLTTISFVPQAVKTLKKETGGDVPPA